MKKRGLRKITVLFCSLLILFGCTITSEASARTLSVSRVQQAKSQWCWAAASEMVGTYGTSSSKNQWDIVNFIWGPTYPNNTGDVSNMVSSVQFASDYAKSATSQSSFFALSTIQSKINSNKPILARFGWNGGGGHSMVISGIRL